jgi:hypothetical protein
MREVEAYTHQLRALPATVQFLDAQMQAFARRYRQRYGSAAASVARCECVCFGLGSPHAAGSGPRVQLAALLLLTEAMQRAFPHTSAAPQVPDTSESENRSEIQSESRSEGRSDLAFRVPVCAFDPLFDRTDRLLLRALGGRPLEENEGGFRPATLCVDAAAGGAPVPTVYYMPHCGSDLYDAVLGANVLAGELQGEIQADGAAAFGADAQAPQLLPAVCVVGNAFSFYLSAWGLEASQASGGTDANPDTATSSGKSRRERRQDKKRSSEVSPSSAAPKAEDPAVITPFLLAAALSAHKTRSMVSEEENSDGEVNGEKIERIPWTDFPAAAFAPVTIHPSAAAMASAVAATRDSLIPDAAASADSSAAANQRRAALESAMLDRRVRFRLAAQEHIMPLPRASDSDTSHLYAAMSSTAVHFLDATVDMSPPDSVPTAK